MRIAILFAVIVLFLHLPAEAERVQIALSMGNTNTARDISAAQSIISGLDEDVFEIRMTNAHGSLSGQISDINSLISDKPDYLVVSAVRSIGLSSVIADAEQAGIPVILVDRFSTDSPEKDTLTRIGTDWSWAGATCADILQQNCQDRQALILEVQGESESNSTQEASKGFRARLRESAGMQLAGVLTGGSDRQSTSQVVLDFIEEKGICFDAVFAHGDEQALGVINALLSASADENIPIVCIGGMDDARRAMLAGKLFAFVRVEDDFGHEVADAIRRHMQGESVEPIILSQGVVQYAAEG